MADQVCHPAGEVGDRAGDPQDAVVAEFDPAKQRWRAAQNPC